MFHQNGGVNPNSTLFGEQRCWTLEHLATKLWGRAAKRVVQQPQAPP
jgi:hypothetical protein